MNENLERILAQLAVQTGVPWRIAGNRLPRRRCVLWFLESPEFREPKIVLKVFPRNPQMGNRLEKLTERTRFYHARSTAAAAVPEPVASLADEGALAVAFIAEAEEATSESITARCSADA